MNFSVENDMDAVLTFSDLDIGDVFIIKGFPNSVYLRMLIDNTHNAVNLTGANIVEFDSTLPVAKYTGTITFKLSDFQYK